MQPSFSVWEGFYERFVTSGGWNQLLSPVIKLKGMIFGGQWLEVGYIAGFQVVKSNHCHNWAVLYLHVNMKAKQIHAAIHLTMALCLNVFM